MTDNTSLPALVEAFAKIDPLIPHWDFDENHWAWRCLACDGVSPTRAAEFHVIGCTWMRAVLWRVTERP